MMLALSRAGSVIFRNNTGMGWVGQSMKATKPMVVHLAPGDVVIRQARPLHAGLCEGSSDIIGLTPVMVDPGHVGTVFGVFTAVEAKTKTGRSTTQQINFVQRIRQLGGYAGIARDAQDAVSIAAGRQV